jgi:hypothetical protein
MVVPPASVTVWPKLRILLGETHEPSFRILGQRPVPLFLLANGSVGHRFDLCRLRREPQRHQGPRPPVPSPFLLVTRQAVRTPMAISIMSTLQSAVFKRTSANATDNTAGWQELAPQLANQPMQIDLFSSAQTNCILAQLGPAVSPPVVINRFASCSFPIRRRQAMPCLPRTRAVATATTAWFSVTVAFMNST